jgi:hypothetical protein
MTKKLAKAGAQSCGINMDVECAWIGPPDQDGFTPFGPDPKKDNIFQNMPQVVECGNIYMLCVVSRLIVQTTIGEPAWHGRGTYLKNVY